MSGFPDIWLGEILFWGYGVRLCERIPGRWSRAAALFWMFRFQNIRIPKRSAYTLFQPDGRASGSPSATARPWAAHPCLCGRMLRDSNILPQSHPKQGRHLPQAVLRSAFDEVSFGNAAREEHAAAAVCVIFVLNYF